MRANEFVYESIRLLEDRIDYLKKAVVPKIEKKLHQLHIPNGIPLTAESLFQWIIDQDPTDNKEYAQWLLNTAFRKKEPVPLEQFDNVKNVLTQFHKIKHTLDNTQKNINSYKSIADLNSTIIQHIAFVDSQHIKEQQRARDESEIIVDTSAWLVAIPKTSYAAQYWGRGSKWCTAYGDPKGLFPDRNCAFDEYINDLKFTIYTCVNKTSYENSVQIGIPFLETANASDIEIKDVEDMPITGYDLEELRQSVSFINKIINNYEKRIANVSMFSYDYALNILEMPWFETSSNSAYDAEYSIATDSEYVADYAINVIGDAWKHSASPVADMAEDTIEQCDSAIDKMASWDSKH